MSEMMRVKRSDVADCGRSMAYLTGLTDACLEIRYTSTERRPLEMGR